MTQKLTVINHYPNIDETNRLTLVSHFTENLPEVVIYSDAQRYPDKFFDGISERSNFEVFILGIEVPDYLEAMADTFIDLCGLRTRGYLDRGPV